MKGITAVVDALPESQRASLQTLIEETRHRHASIKEASCKARDAIDDWRLMCKYIIFDLEASLREAKTADGSANGNAGS